MKQGYPLSDSQIQKVNYLLETTDMSMVDIATTIGCARSTVSKLNQHHKIRNYENRRSSWRLTQTEDSVVPS